MIDTVLNAVLKGHTRLWDVMQEKDALYAKADFSDADGIRASELEEKFADMDGWNAESDAATLLSNLGIKEDLHYIHDERSEWKAKSKGTCWPRPSLESPTTCCWMNPPTIWTWTRSAGWRITSPIMRIPSWWFPTTGTSWMPSVRTPWILISERFKCLAEITATGTRAVSWHLRQQQKQNKKAEEKKKELQEFIRRFSANVAKSKQTTSRKKMIEKLNIEDIKPSTRKYPGIIFTPERKVGDRILDVTGLSASVDGEVLFRDVNFQTSGGDKIIFPLQGSKGHDRLF